MVAAVVIGLIVSVIDVLFLLIIYAVLILVSIIILIISIKNKSIIWILFSTIFLLFLVSFLFINKLDEVRICNDDVKNDLKFLKKFLHAFRFPVY